MVFQDVNKTQKNIKEGKKFTIEANAAAFKVLTDKLYKNPIRAIVRELSTNAIDACKEANIPLNNFTVTVPTEEQPTFSVQDNGIGMSAEQIESIYTTFFASTKTTDNNQTGMFGLGSKTPFAYTKAFCIQSSKNGIQNTYLAYIEDDGSLALTKTSSVPTNVTGTKISFAVQEKDIDEFKEAITYCFLTWPEMPKIENTKALESYVHCRYTIADIEELNNERIHILSNTFVSSKVLPYKTSFLEMGNVLYYLDWSQLPIQYRHTNSLEVINTTNIVLHANIGDVMITPNREDLQYTENTSKFIYKESATAYCKYVINTCKDSSFLTSANTVTKSRIKDDIFYKYCNVVDKDTWSNYVDLYNNTLSEIDKYNEVLSEHNNIVMYDNPTKVYRPSFRKLKYILNYKNVTNRVILITDKFEKVFDNCSGRSTYVTNRLSALSNPENQYVFVTEKGLDILKKVTGNDFEVISNFDSLYVKQKKNCKSNVELEVFTNDSQNSSYTTIDKIDMSAYDYVLALPTLRDYVVRLTMNDLSSKQNVSSFHSTSTHSYSYCKDLQKYLPFGKNNNKRILVITGSVPNLRKIKIWEYSKVKTVFDVIPSLCKNLLEKDLEGYKQNASTYRSAIFRIFTYSDSAINLFKSSHFKEDSLFAKGINNILTKEPTKDASLLYRSAVCRLDNNNVCTDLVNQISSYCAGDNIINIDTDLVVKYPMLKHIYITNDSLQDVFGYIQLVDNK